MKVLFVGGTGIISSACVALALARSYEVSILNRGNRPSLPTVHSIVCDINDLDTAESILASERWDAVVDFTVFTPEQMENRIRLFAGKVKQYLFISSASAYEKPLRNYLITEETPLVNPFWQYSRDKARCEAILLQASNSGQLPGTVVRPSLTYGDTHVPLVLNSWNQPYTIIDRMRRGAPVVIPGDGTSLWTVTHSSDFAKGLIGLLGNGKALGECFHITSDEVLTWDRIFSLTARAAGVRDLAAVHIASDFITACLPDKVGSLHGDKSVSAVFDNSKIKSFVPGFEATVSFAEGIERSVANMDRDENLRSIDLGHNRIVDQLIAAYRSGLDAARSQFGNP
ncbi:SDR family oxidoreductase [Pelagicoccus sp. NFK12]|uniref:UDP-glucose 4-epimerase n=1 Tax=Pelagicoccus enzymogenes TaxID=2773457 RepID=A0A927IFL1_9BACT|nr:SDR family oxidoreductase [Pelagicoccus enzymogenes]MBD5780222.1 SDR family oxidoreductase [Pelagicoccus enzymogenes]